MTRLSKEIRKSLLEEAKDWDTAVAREPVEDVQKLLDEAGPFEVPRPAPQPVSLRLDPYDISMIKRFARKKGVPHTQLMALWLQEKIEQEKKVSAPD